MLGADSTTVLCHKQRLFMWVLCYISSLVPMYLTPANHSLTNKWELPGTSMVVFILYPGGKHFSALFLQELKYTWTRQNTFLHFLKLVPTSLNKDWQTQCVLSVPISNWSVTYQRRTVNHCVFVIKPHLSVMKALADWVTFKSYSHFVDTLFLLTGLLTDNSQFLFLWASAGILASLHKLVQDIHICHSLSPFYICGQNSYEDHLPNGGAQLFNNYSDIKVRQKNKKLPSSCCKRPVCGYSR